MFIYPYEPTWVLWTDNIENSFFNQCTVSFIIILFLRFKFILSVV